jgi:hypothetical protein
MVKREEQTTQWPKEKNRQHNGQKRRTDNTMVKREDLFFSFDHCVVCSSLLTIVLSVLLF